MKWTISLVTFLMLQGALASEESVQVQKSIKALIDPILRKNQTTEKDFTLANCEKHKIDWGAVLLMRNAPSLKYSFSPGCDIEGEIRPGIMKIFPVDLKLKNLQNFERLVSENKITPSLEEKPVLNLAIRAGKLISKKGEVKFEADYAIKLDYNQQNQLIYHDLGGEIRINEVYGTPSSIKEKFKLK